MARKSERAIICNNIVINVEVSDTVVVISTLVTAVLVMDQQIGMQMEMHAHPGITAQITEVDRVLRLLPSTVTGDSSNVSERPGG